MRQNGQNSFCNCLHIWYFYFYINCTTSKVPAIYNFNYVILNYKSTNYFPIDKFSEFCRLGTIDVIHRLVVTNRRFSRIDELCLTALPMGTSLGTTKSFTMKMPSSTALVVAPKTQSTSSAAAKQLRNLHSGHKNHAPMHR